MYLIVIAWLYVTLMMAVAEATSPVGSVLGALITLVLYGLLPIGLLVYILGTPARKRRRAAQQASELANWRAHQSPAPSIDPDTGRHPASTAKQGGVPPSGVPPMRKEL